MDTFETDPYLIGCIDGFINEDIADGTLIFEELQPLNRGYEETVVTQQPDGFAYDLTPITVATDEHWPSTDYFTDSYEGETLISQYEYYENPSYLPISYDELASPATTISQSCYSASPSPSFDDSQSSASSSSFEHNTSPPSQRRGRGRPRKVKVELGSEKLRKFRSEKQALDDDVQTYAWRAIYHGITNEVVVSEDYELAVTKIAEQQGWKPRFLNKLQYSESVAPTRGRKRKDSGESELQRGREYTRRYNAQRKPGVYFLLLKDVLTQLKEISPSNHERLLKEIKISSSNLYNNLIGDKIKSQRNST
uniref:BHLH domain-containing protein n=1 Tax=Panagrellus redivivus TaxID=6233 RepID=A0A7E4VRM1_PANRE